MKNKLSSLFLSSIAASFILLAPALHAADGTWNVDVNGLWSTNANWLSSTIANGSNSIASFTNDITANRTVSLDTDRTINRVNFGDSDISSAGSWILDNNGDTNNNLILSGTTGAASGTVPVIDVGALGIARTATVSAIIQGTYGLTKTGSGTLRLTGVNTYTGTTTINAGTVNDTTRATIGAITLADVAGATLDFTGITGSKQIGSLSGGGTNGGNIVNTAGLYFGSASSASYGGIISGTGFMTQNGTGTQTLSGMNTYTGETAINKGTLSINSISNVGGGASSLGNPTTVAKGTITIGATTTTGTLLYTGSGHTTDRVVNLGGTTGGATLDASGSGALVFTSAFMATGLGAKTLTLTGTNTADNGIGGAIVNNTSNTLTTAASTTSTALVLASVDGLTVGNAISGAGIPALTTISAINTNTKTVTLSATATVANGAVITSAGLVNKTSLTKAGTGTWILSGTNTYTGATTVSNGVLLVHGLTTNSAITVVSGGTLGGTGKVGSVTVNTDGIITGNGTNTVGTLTATNLTFSESAVIYWNYDDTTNDVIKVATLGTLPNVATVTVSRVTGSTRAQPLPAVLCTFEQGGPGVDKDLSGWVVTGGSDGTRVVVRGNQIQFRAFTGTLLQLY